MSIPNIPTLSCNTSPGLLYYLAICCQQIIMPRMARARCGRDCLLLEPPSSCYSSYPAAEDLSILIVLFFFIEMAVDASYLCPRTAHLVDWYLSSMELEKKPATRRHKKCCGHKPSSSQKGITFLLCHSSLDSIGSIQAYL
jgi:hypothetical protein